MPINKHNHKNILATLEPYGATLVAVSKMKPTTDIQELYKLGQRDFGENYVQELMEKKDQLPTDIRWHFIGHLQSNKVKYIVPFVHLVHGVDSEKLLKEINKSASKLGIVCNCLLQVDISGEATKFGLDERELKELMQKIEAGNYANVQVQGLMGMAGLDAGDEETIEQFKKLYKLYVSYPQFETLSMGMSGDYQAALDCGSNMVRIGSLLFGVRSIP